jgi:Putative zinc-finger
VSGPGQCAQICPELGVYVLGVISPADRAMVSRHLASCPRCRKEVADLAGLPALLSRVPVNTAVQLSEEGPPDQSSPPEALLDGLIGRVGAVRRRWSLAAAAVILAAVAAAAAGWASHVLRPAAPPPRPAASWWAATARGFDAAIGAWATVRYTPQPWGTEVAASVSGIRPGTSCQIWATTVSGQQEAVGSWTVTRGESDAWYPASVSFPAASLASFDITAHDKVLVTIPLRPGPQSAPAHAAGGWSPRKRG